MCRPAAAVLLVFLFLACSGVSPDAASGPEGSPEAFDIVILGGHIVDGTGNAGFPGDVGIQNDQITAITPAGLLANAETELSIDATDMVVSPGFIDIQSHSRSSFLGDGDGRVVSKVTMGVTTEIMGESTTNGPSSPAMLEAAGDATGSTVFETFGDWMRAMESHGASVNVGSFVGASTVRVLGKGEAMGEADAEELALMQDAVRQSMEDGAFGVASALIYPPGNFASTRELIEINRAAAPYGGVYITHLRSEADYFLEAIDEAIDIGTTAGVPIEIYHLKAGGRRNWSKASQAVAKIDSARAAGVDIQANMYPYTAGGTGLTACFPPWASADGKLFDNLADSDARMRIRAEIENQTTEWENLCTLSTPEGVLLLGFNKPDNQRYSGRYLSDISEELGKDWIDTAFDLVLDERQRLGTIYFMMSEENVAMQIGQPWMKFGTDAGGIDPETARGLTHPRAYGTFTRILGKYVREEGATTLEEAVRKMSSAVATRLHIKNRGLLKEGFFADIVVFDPNTVSDHATYDEPHQVSTGVHYVLVNGVPVVSQGEHTDRMPGRPVYGPGWTGWDR
ncbi:MAG TPA: dihydroorotase [Gemmatimonadetes bacterium]|nr:dihydroorotase [Gemmatimonadota bacterium]|tara:strand:- start:962 stop:2668 length:1707 start_codon:yes stop_codon:yes gene_type:complete